MIEGHMPAFELDQADAVSWLRTLATESVDLVVTDPPYESLEKHRAIGTTTRLQTWFPIFANERFPELLREVWRVLRPDRHFYLHCDAETAFIIKPMAEAAGFKFWKPLVWDKVAIGMGYHYRATYEFILFFEKGKRRLNDRGVPDVIRVKRVRGKYPTEKPVEIGELLIRQSTFAGELVIDPFMGSGSVGEAALGMGRRFGGCDISNEAIVVASARLGAMPASHTELVNEGHAVLERSVRGLFDVGQDGEGLRVGLVAPQLGDPMRDDRQRALELPESR